MPRHFDDRTDVGPAPTAPDDTPRQLADADSPLAEAVRSFDDLAATFRNLGRADRWAAGALLVLLVSLALPWRWTREDDDVIGLVAAWPVGLLAAATLTALALRVRRAGAVLERRLKAAQLAGALATALYAGVFVATADQSKSLRGAGKLVTVALATAQPASWAGALCAVVALFASAAALADGTRA